MITSAAVKIFDYKQNKELTIPCHRHCDAFQILHDFGYTRADFREIAQGFLDEHDNFYSRPEAWKHAVECVQVAATDSSPHELFSEDLY